MSSSQTSTPLAAAVSDGIACYRRGDYTETIRILEHAAAELGSAEQLPPRALAAYAVAIAVSDRRRTADAVRFCQFAIRRNPVDADLHHALAQVYLRVHSKRKAVRAVAQGLRVDPGHAGLQRCLDGLGRRSTPCVPFLSRQHVINRVLGRIRHAVRGGK
jgi:tetratricopeptide (TPR) repeat protein